MNDIALAPALIATAGPIKRLIAERMSRRLASKAASF